MFTDEWISLPLYTTLLWKQPYQSSRTLKTSPQIFVLYPQWQVLVFLENFELIVIIVASFLTTCASMWALVFLCPLGLLKNFNMIKHKLRKAGEDLCLRHLTISRFIHNRRYISSDSMHVNVVLILLNIWNMLIRLCSCSFMLMEMPHFPWCLLPRQSMCCSSHWAGVKFSSTRLRSLEVFEER